MQSTILDTLFGITLVLNVHLPITLNLYNFNVLSRGTEILKYVLWILLGSCSGSRFGLRLLLFQHKSNRVSNPFAP